MNKTLKKTLSIIIAILMIVTTMPFAFAADATLVINMTDSFGDGWSGNAIQVGTVSDGVFTKIADATIDDGATATYEGVISDESIYAFRWTKGDYAYECSFDIRINGETVFETSDCSSYDTDELIYIWCNHSFTDSICSICGLTCGVDFAHTTNSDGKCTVCGYICDNHSYTNHYCKACGNAENGYYVGACGAKNVYDAIWSFDSEGTLTISGTGDYDVNYNDAPWQAYDNSIKNVVIEEGITNVAEGSFLNLTNAVSLSIPSTVNKINNNSNNYFAEIKLAEGNAFFSLVDGVLFNADKTELLWYPAKKADESYTVPAGVTVLDSSSFSNAENLKIINISDDVTSIGYGCFNYSSLETVNFGANVESIGLYAFAYTRLKTVVLPEKLTEIPYALFYVCSSLENLVIGSNVTSIDEDVISYCDKLETVHFMGTEAQWEAITKPEDTTDAINTITVHSGTEERAAFAATCTEDGYTAGWYCSDCEEYIVDHEEITALGHDFADGICTVCEYECEHNFVDGTCTVCSGTCENLGHNFVDGTCTVCSGTCENLGHNFVDGTCTVCSGTCENLGHNFADGICTVCEYECEHEFNLDRDIKAPLICNSCNSVYASDSRWQTGTYEEVFENVNIAQFKGNTVKTDEIVAYYGVKTVDGYEYDMSFDWAINQGFTDYGKFTLKLYHNGNEIIFHDFTVEPNPYRNILSEEYHYTAEGEIQVFKFVFTKTDKGWWADTGRIAYLNNIEHLCVMHSGEATCTEPAICEICNEKFADALGHDFVDGICTVCEYECEHDFVDGICTVCEYECDHPVEGDYIYTASGNTITETCGLCNVETGTLTISAPADLYTDGTIAREAVVDNQLVDTSVAVDVTYSTEDGKAPTTAGTYTANVTIEGATASVEFTLLNYAASVTIDGETNYYKTLDEAWNAAKGNTATLTITDNCETENWLEIESGDVTLDTAGYTATAGSYSVSGGKLTVTGNGTLVHTTASLACVSVYGGEFVLESGTIERLSLYPQTSDVIATINGGVITGDVSINDSDTYSATFTVNGGTFTKGRFNINGTPDVQLKGGEFTNRIFTIDFPLNDLLAEGCYFRDADGKLIEVADDATEIFDYVQVTKGADLSEAVITLSQTEYTYNGFENEPTVTVTIGGKTIDSSNYTVTYADNTNAGLATVTITAVGQNAGELAGGGSISNVSNAGEVTSNAYTGEVTLEFTINPKTVDIIWSETTEFDYDGNAHSVTATYVDVNGETVEAVVTNGTNTKPGKYTATASIADTNYAINEETASVDYAINGELSLSGTVTSFLSETDEITLTLVNVDDAEIAYETVVNGNSANYTFENLVEGTYTLIVEKANHATRTYEVVVGEEDVTQNVKIHLKGDINGDGKISVVDYALVLNHVNKISILEGYEFACADVDTSGKVTVVDYSRILAHVNKTVSLW